MTLKELLNLYNNKYPGDGKIHEDDIQEYSTSEPMDTQKLLSLYELRNDIYKEKKGKDNIKFKVLIEELNSCNEPRIIMHFFRVVDKLFMILTNITSTEVIARLEIQVDLP